LRAETAGKAPAAPRVLSEPEPVITGRTLATLLTRRQPSAMASRTVRQEWRRPCGAGLLCADVPIVQHPVDCVVAPDTSPLRMEAGVGGRWGPQHGHPTAALPRRE